MATKKMLKRDFQPDLIEYCEEKAAHALYTVVEVEVPDEPKPKKPSSRKAKAKAKPAPAPVAETDLGDLFNGLDDLGHN